MLTHQSSTSNNTTLSFSSAVLHDDEVMLKCVIGRLIFISRIYAKASVFHQTRTDVSYACTICNLAVVLKCINVRLNFPGRMYALP